MRDARQRLLDFWTFSYLGNVFTKIFGLIVCIRVKKHSKTNLVVSRHIKRQKALLTVEARQSKTPLLKLPNSKWHSLLSREGRRKFYIFCCYFTEFYSGFSFCWAKNMGPSIEQQSSGGRVRKDGRKAGFLGGQKKWSLTGGEH